MRAVLLFPRRVKPVRGILRDTSGTSVLLAVTLFAIIGFAALGTEVASWYLTKRTMQSAVDAAASAAAADLAANSSASSTQLQSAAKAVAATFGFVSGSNGTNLDLQNPPSSGPYSGNSLYVQVGITQPQTPLLTSLFMSTGPTIAATATALANRQVSDQGCVLALSGASIVDVQLNGNVNLSFSNCAMYDNSPLQSGALSLGNNTSLNAKAVYIVGTPNQTTGITTTDTNGIHTGTNPAADPYASVAVPTAHRPCDSPNKLNNPNTTLSVTADGTYVFCKDVSMDTNGSGATLTLNPGIYIFDSGANLKMTSGTLRATGGVTLVFEDSTGGGAPGTLSVSGNANVFLTAPTTGPTAGLAIFQSRVTCTSSTTNCTNTLSGTGTLDITGAIYFPNNPVAYSGGSGAGGTSQCTQLIANTITFSGGATFSNNCTNTGTQVISLTNGQIVM